MQCLALCSTNGLRRGLAVKDAGGPLTAPVGEIALGRVLNVFGEPIDNGTALADAVRLPADGHGYGQGPNWRIRTIREALVQVGLNPDILRHGIGREVFAMPIAESWRAYLQATEADASIGRPPISAIGEAALSRWILPRAERYTPYRDWTRDHTLGLLRPILPE